jgi:hypothetical protein
MKKPNIQKLIKGAQLALSKHSPEILTGIGIAGMVATTVLAVGATPKALDLIAEAEDEKEEPLTKIETVKVAWKPYIPAAITCTASIACIIGASSVHLKRNAAIAAAYKLSETALSDYKAKVIETIGEKQERVVREKVNQEHIEKTPVSKNEVIITEKGNTLCYDSISGRYFKSDIEQIKKVVNILNRRMMSEMYISLNEFYDELDLEHISVGDDLGWNIDKGLMDIDFSSHIADDGTPCIVIDHMVAPQYGYDRL